LIAVVASLPATADRDALTVTLAACIALAAIWQRAKSTGVERRARDGALVAALAYAAVLAGVAAVRLTGGDLGSAGVHLYESVVAVTALGLAVDLRRGTWAPSAVAGLVADLGTASSGGNLSDRLARALGDPDVKLFLRTTNGWMDADGAPLSPPRPGPGQIAASIDQDGEEVAVLIHDEVLKTQQGLLHGAAAAARLAVSNAQLETEVLGSVEEVRASRRRLVEAADEQRRRLEAELRGGAERELELAAATVDRVVERDPSLAAIANEIERAREDLRRFARGIHPAVLTQGGLRRALEDLVVGGSMAVRLEVDHERWPPPTEITAYFVCTEAKHAPGANVQVRVRGNERSLQVDVTDDGTGGATINPNGGLQGLSDRVAALGGSLVVESKLGEGTRVAATLPL
jgi:signal transduction histidine kinase